MCNLIQKNETVISSIHDRHWSVLAITGNVQPDTKKWNCYFQYTWPSLVSAITGNLYYEAVESIVSVDYAILITINPDMKRKALTVCHT